MPIKLPDDVQSVPPGLSTTLSAVDNIEATVRQALQEPIGRPLLGETARPDWKVTIAFDDPTVPK
jgi:nickel-dependent lactate racemase